MLSFPRHIHPAELESRIGGPRVMIEGDLESPPSRSPDDTYSADSRYPDHERVLHSHLYQNHTILCRALLGLYKARRTT